MKSTTKVITSIISGTLAAIFIASNVNTFEFLSANLNTAIALFVSIICGFATMKAVAMILSKKAPLKSSSFILVLMALVATVFIASGDYAIVVFVAPILIMLLYKGNFKNKYVFE